MHKSLPGLEGGVGSSGRVNSLAKPYKQERCSRFWNSEFSQEEIHSEGGRCWGIELVNGKDWWEMGQ